MMIVYCKQALSALKDNSLRTLLSITGITVGIAAVMIVASVSEGGQSHIYSELETFGLTSFWVRRDYHDDNPNRAIRTGSGINNYDYQNIRTGACSATRRITPLISVRSGRIVVQIGNHYSNSNILGVGADYAEINNDTIAHGRFFQENDMILRKKVVIIGTETQNDLFENYQDPLGQDIRIGSRKFTVIGVLKDKSRDFLSSIGSSRGQDANHRVLMPYTVFQQLFANGDKGIMILQGEAVNLSKVNLAATQIINLLERKHDHRYSYKYESMVQYINTANKILGGVTMIGIIAASVSLFVGGIGIMNIMSTAVVERTQEIGLRKAMGAHKRDILFQFLIEAMLISGIGGILGLGLGAVTGYLLENATGFPLASPWGLANIALLVSITVGLISGYYPAYRAASLKPVEALRHE
jgi:ABC-type antimicrobial peptide transport system permease subunit